MMHRETKDSIRVGISTDKDISNADFIIFKMKSLGLTISSAESVTAGGFGSALTRIPGSSAVYKGGVQAYTREVKKKILHIPDEVLDKGLVTPETTMAMAQAAIKLFDTTFAAACTGNAGPTTDDAEGSIGRIYWVVIDRNGNSDTKEHDFAGNRDEVRTKAVTNGLRMVRNFVELALIEYK
ncbi:MAG TPA: CinA family protein [bacterium]|jgi:PncC family amidohydrolase